MIDILPASKTSAVDNSILSKTVVNVFVPAVKIIPGAFVYAAFPLMDHVLVEASIRTKVNVPETVVTADQA